MRAPSRVQAAWLVLLLGWPSVALASVADYLGRRIVGVQMEAEGRPVTDVHLVALVETQVGGTLSMQHVRESIAHLASLGRFQDVEVYAERAGDGVALRYDLIPIHPVRQITFQGNLALSRNQLRTAVIDRFGASPPVGRAPDVARLLKDLYLEHGYLRATVSPRVDVRHVRETSTLVLEIEAGPQARIGTITIEGDARVPPPQVLDRLGFHAGDPYDPADITKRLTKYSDELRSRGHYQARVSHVARFADEDRTAHLVITIEPGPHVTVVFTGDAIPAAARDTLVPIRREGSVDEDLLEDSSHRLEEYFHAQGYKDATGRFRRESSDGELRIVFEIHRGPQHRIARIEVSGNASVALAEVEPLLRLHDGQLFVQSQLDADVETLRDQYLRRGFTQVTVQSDVADTGTAEPGAVPGAAHLVIVRLVVTEGVRTVVRTVAFDGNRALTVAELSQGLETVPGRPFYAPTILRDRDALQLKYLNRGYVQAAIEPQVTPADGGEVADVKFSVGEGVQVFIDHVLIVGNSRISRATIERELLVKPGRPLAFDDVNESQRRLAALGVFRRIRITELRHESPTRRDLLVSVDEAPVTTIGYGGGLEGGPRLRQAADQGGQAEEHLEFAPRGFFEIGRRNLWGKNRSINLFSRVSLRHKNEPTTGTTGGDGFGFSEYRLFGVFREPRLLNTSADGLVSGFFEQAIRSSFNFARRGVRAELTRRLTPQVSFIGRYAFDRTRLFDERYSQTDKPLIDRLFPQVRLSSFSSSIFRDSRDDSIEPGAGALIGIDGQIATRAIGSEVGLGKTFLQGFMYRRLAPRRRVILAAGGRLGLATGFPRGVERTDATGQPITGPDGRPIMDEVRDLPASERFFAGGDTTVRGFALDQLGAPDTIDPNGFPKGGHALVILNAELRVPVWRALDAVGFLDAGNVFARVDDVSLTDIRSSVGFGLRYRSPLGPVRADLGFKLDRRQFASGRLEPLTAFHISLGQAF